LCLFPFEGQFAWRPCSKELLLPRPPEPVSPFHLHLQRLYFITEFFFFLPVSFFFSALTCGPKLSFLKRLPPDCDFLPREPWFPPTIALIPFYLPPSTGLQPLEAGTYGITCVSPCVKSSIFSPPLNEIPYDHASYPPSIRRFSPLSRGEETFLFE